MSPAPTSASPDATRPIALVVAGMHRSGTSAVARVLSLCGFDLPRTLMPSSAFNEDGHWESEIFRAGNDGLLEQMGSSWDDALFLRAMPRLGLPRDAAEAIQSTIRDEFEPGRDIVVKDPRIALLFPLWHRALDDLGYQVRLVVPMRNPLEVAASLNQRNGFPPAKSALLWLSHLLSLERDSRGVQRVFLAYDDLLADWRGCMRRVERVLGISLSGWSDATEREIDQFLSSDRRHHRYDDEALAARSDIPRWIREAYGWAISAAHDDDEPAPALLSQIADHFGAASEIYAALVSSGGRRADESEEHARPEQQLAAVLYSAVASSDFSEETCARAMLSLTRVPRAFQLQTPERSEPLTAIRLDPANAPGFLVLYALRVRTPDGASSWQWNGDVAILKSSSGVVATQLTPSSAMLEFTDHDPQLQLPSEAVAGDHRQVTVEIVASTAGETEIARHRIAQLLSTVRELSAQSQALAQSFERRLKALEDGLDRVAVQQDDAPAPSRSFGELARRVRAAIRGRPGGREER